MSRRIPLHADPSRRLVLVYRTETLLKELPMRSQERRLQIHRPRPSITSRQLVPYACNPYDE